MSKPVHIQDLAVNRMYGRVFRLLIKDLAPGLNIIWGPNGSGKTTVAHALQAVLLKRYPFSEQANIAATLRIGQDALRFNIDGPRRFCTRNGQQVTWDSAPKLIRPDSYHFSLHDLLSAESRGHDFAEAILREGSGGFDLRKARTALGFEQKKNIRAGSVTRSFLQAQKNRRAVEQEQKSLLKQKKRSRQLATDLDKAKMAEQDVGLFQKALDWQAKKLIWQEAEDTLKRFPESIRIRADLSKVESDAGKLKDAIAAHNAKRLDNSASLARLEHELKQNSLYPDGLASDVLPIADRRLVRLRDLESKCQRLREDLAGSHKRADNAWVDLKMNSQVPEALSKESVDRLYELIASRINLRGRQEAMDVLRNVLEIEEDTNFDDALFELRQMQSAVVSWIKSRRAHVPRGVHIILILALVGSIAASVGFGITFSSAAFFGLVISILIGLAYWQLTRPQQMDQALPNMPELADRLRKGEAGDILNELIDDHSSLAIRQRSQVHWRAKLTDRERLAADLKKLENDSAALADETGLTSVDTRAGEVFDLRRLIAWLESTDYVKELEGRYEDKIAEFNAELSKLNTTIGQYGESEAVDVQEADALVHELRSRNETWKALSSQFTGLQSESDRIVQGLSVAETDYDNIFARLELKPGDMEGLRICALRHLEFLNAQKAHVQACAVLEQAQRAVENAPGYKSSILERDDLQEALSSAQSQADKRELLQEELTTIRLNIERVEKGRSLEGALTTLYACQHDLIQARNADAAKAVGHVLARRLDEYIRQQQLPKVFDRARKNFLDITRGKYELRFDLTGKFSALDTTENRHLSLDQLSSGTRVQLLLSVRMAFVQEQELDYRLPVTLDETLGNSDDERARVVITTLARVAQERQVFYFTAQNDEVAKWKQHCGDIPINVVALTDEARPVPVDPDLVPQFSAVPRAAGLTHAQYGTKLRPPRWNGHSEVSEIHLWYLIDDATQLQSILSEGVTSWGAAQALYESGVLKLPGNVYARVRTLALALKAWQASWKTGRGRPVDSAVLAASGAVSQSFMENVLSKCEDCDNDADDLLQALRNGQVKGFRANKINDLERYFLEHGYASTDSTKSPEEIQSDMMIAIAEDLSDCGLDVTDINRMLERVRSGPPVV